MAQRAKGTYRGKKYTRKSLRPGKRTVKVRAYCRSKHIPAFLRRSDTPF